MPNDCPTIDISEKEDAAYFFAQVREHAVKVVKQELARDNLGKDKQALAACQKSIDEVGDDSVGILTAYRRTYS
jgi:hypothetical protein